MYVCMYGFTTWTFGLFYAEAILKIMDSSEMLQVCELLVSIRIWVYVFCESLGNLKQLASDPV